MTSAFFSRRSVRSIVPALSCLLALPAGLTPLHATIADADLAVAGKPEVIFTTRDAGGGLSAHLPSLLVTRRGTVIAVCQIRKGSSDDWGHETDLVLRRSEDGGLTWKPTQIVVADPTVNAVDGPIVEDAATGTLILPFTKVPSVGTTQADWVRYFAQHGGSVWVTRSTDEGRTWSAPVESKPHGANGWIAWAGNSSHGVQLATGRLVIAGFAHQVRAGETFHALDLKSCLMFSDDHGQTWTIGALTPFYGTDELALAVGHDGSLVASIRINNRTPHDLVRLIGRSLDGGVSFAECGLQDNLSINACHAGMISLVDKSTGTERYILAHSGPQGGHAQAAHPDRTRLTLRLSYDDGRSWPVSRLLVAQPKNTEYSDLAVAPDGTILCLYGVNTFEKAGSRIELLRFSLASVEREYSPLKN